MFFDNESTRDFVWTPTMFGNIVTEALAPKDHVSNDMRRLISSATARLLDSEIIVESPFTGETRPQFEYESGDAPPSDLTQPLDDVIEMVRAEGFNPHFKSLLNGFARLTSRFLISSPLRARKDNNPCQHGTVFLMTDAGGSSVSEWKSRVFFEDGVERLLIDKIWIIGSEKPSFGLVAVKKEGGLYPVPFIITPEQCADLTWTPAGAPFVGDLLQLGSIQGVVAINEMNRIESGSHAMINRLLTLVRPYFVRAILAYLSWLETQGRMILTSTHRALIAELEAISAAVCSNGRYSNLRMQQALALKFACNELLTTLIIDDCVKGPQDARDLMAFGKMEGSSYRCFKEIYARVVPSRRKPLAQRSSEVA